MGGATRLLADAVTCSASCTSNAREHAADVTYADIHLQRGQRRMPGAAGEHVPLAAALCSHGCSFRGPKPTVVFAAPYRSRVCAGRLCHRVRACAAARLPLRCASLPQRDALPIHHALDDAVNLVFKDNNSIAFYLTYHHTLAFGLADCLGISKYQPLGVGICHAFADDGSIDDAVVEPHCHALAFHSPLYWHSHGERGWLC